jgi:hypothetical protein
MNKLRQILARIGRWVWSSMTSSSFWKVTGGVVLSLVIVIGLIVAVQIVPEWQVNRAGVHSAPIKTEAMATAAEIANLQNEMRRTILQVLGGLFAIFALYLTFRRVKVAEQGHITDRYTKAIEQLGALTAAGKPNVEVRLGAIYALERIAQDSPRDHWTIMEVLTAYVRQNAPAPVQAPTEEENKAAIEKGPTTEIQAILTVLGRRKRERGREQKGQNLDLGSSDLRGADLRGAHIEGSDFKFAHLEGAIFYQSHMEGVFIYDAHAEGAWFGEAHLEGARFHWTHLEGAKFEGAHLEGMILFATKLERADFRGALGLTVEQFESLEGWESAVGWEQAQFDEAFRRKLEAARGKSNSQS